MTRDGFQFSGQRLVHGASRSGPGRIHNVIVETDQAATASKDEWFSPCDFPGRDAIGPAWGAKKECLRPATHFQSERPTTGELPVIQLRIPAQLFFRRAGRHGTRNHKRAEGNKHS
jgi:hypothetical protein